ncbi:MAG: 50S ribosomal protein L24P [Candidatus Diapherotrites archaeon ADurb.Bin253]|jgi:large subunit ribosomal protein L24|nr:MAG: 50S ribosomal protein L24P [Candidatus Diapherotrites archaeon ADurb.Bin253]HNZ52262.1 50S ribosomal protein L24 [Candidatus Pacearchaeota archaeon]HOH04322.1 50S ribosomal protein L24 [Candidatus Pacearchaeota archaeon]HPX74671.1 50S ribosomal protein L24 [Candidatus Pacearchaeota archaeon]HQC61301.1 50S ribosomal protein L24 [Candidatus Pacearchaeota archaeon]
MKKKFSTHWKSSKQPRKKRKYVANAPLHLRKKFVSINLSKELRKKTNKRNIPAKKGDKVKICVGKFKGKTGKILTVNLKTSKIIVEEIQVKKQDGSKVNFKLQPSNLQIIELAERKSNKKNKQKEEKKESSGNKNKEKGKENKK